MGRKPCCSREDLNRGAWTTEEDRVLKAYIKDHAWRREMEKPPQESRFNQTQVVPDCRGEQTMRSSNYWNTCLRKKVQGQHQLKRCQPPTNETPLLVRTKAIRCANLFITPQQHIAQNQERDIAIDPAMIGELATSKAPNSKSNKHSFFTSKEDTWWDVLVGLDKSNNVSTSEAPDFDFMQLCGSESPCNYYTRREDFKGVLEEMSDTTLPDFDLELKSLANFLDCEEGWLGGGL